jgi:curli biogenesis system outer membrane secretion channel CsgG
MKLKLTLLALALLGSLVACGEKKADPAEAEKAQTSTANEQSQSPEAK